MIKKEIRAYISRTDHIEVVREYSKSNSFDCILIVNDQKVPVKLNIPDQFPYESPYFILPRFDYLGFLPHILPLGNICYVEKESVYINIDEPEFVFQASVELAIQTLKDGLEGKNHQGFREELNVYWQRNIPMASGLLAYSYINPENQTKTILVEKQDKKILTLYQDRYLFKGQRSTSQRPIESGLYIPLQAGDLIIPPKYDEQWNTEQFIAWLKPKVSQENWQCAITYLQDKPSKKFEYLILGIPRTTGPTLLVGIYLEPRQSLRHPFLFTNSDWKIKLIDITRYDKAAILPRSGASMDLQNKKILLIGCGSVGSHLTLMLVKAGIGTLNLVDPDYLQAENIHRYAIGFQYSGKPKVEALRAYISRNFPYTEVVAYPKLIEQLLKNIQFKKSKYDLIISATGDPTINFLLSKQNWDAPLLIGWNEPMGIGGHAILNFPRKKGCYKCLFRDGYNIASFAAKEQAKPFHKKHLGCGEVFTPYTDLDSIRTSELMARMAIDCLKGNIDQAQVLSWKGTATEFQEQGFQLSNRYQQQNQAKMNAMKQDFINPNCPYCKLLP